MKIVKAYLILLLGCSITHSATYYVDQTYPGAADINVGSSTAPWLTIHKANQTLVAGDIVYVGAGTYDERINPTNSGTSGNFITYISIPNETVIIRQVSYVGKDYIRVIGFEITHNFLDYNNAVEIYDANHCQILNNTIHHVRGQAVRNNTYYANSNYNIIRGNTIYYTGSPNTGNQDDLIGANGVNLNGSYNLVEYNDLSHTADFFDLNGSNNIIRNNYVHDFANSDFPAGPGDGVHVDFWQPFSIPDNITNNCVVEKNYAADIYESNSHFFQVRDELLLGISELLIRGNVGIRFGSYVAQFGAADYTRMYNNTYVDFAYNQAKPWATVGYNGEYPPARDDPSINNFNFNNIYYNVCRTDGYIIGTYDGSSVNAQNNATEGSGSHSSSTVTSNINFIDYGSDDLLLSSSSDCINAGRVITTVTSADGSGTFFDVVDANFFYDGYGIAEGDLIKVGTNTPVRITAIAGYTITVASSISWTNGDNVYWIDSDGSPDIGAYEYGDVLLTGAEISSLGSTYTVTSIGDARFVIFYQNGIPHTTDYDEPYTAVISTGKVTAKAYALHAQVDPVVSAQEISLLIFIDGFESGSTSAWSP